MSITIRNSLQVLVYNGIPRGTLGKNKMRKNLSKKILLPIIILAIFLAPVSVGIKIVSF